MIAEVYFRRISWSNLMKGVICEQNGEKSRKFIAESFEVAGVRNHIKEWFFRIGIDLWVIKRIGIYLNLMFNFEHKNGNSGGKHRRKHAKNNEVFW